IRDEKVQFNRRLEDLAKTASPAQKELLVTIGQAYETYAAEVVGTVTLAKRVGGSVEIGAAQAEINQSVAASRVEALALRQAVSAYADHASENADAVSSQTAATAVAANAAMIAAAAIGVVIGIVAGLLIGIAGIGRPLSRIIEIVVRLSRADTSVEIFGTERKDEVGDIARAM